MFRGYAQRLEALRQRGGSLLLVGGPGTGKTHLACAILTEVIRTGRTGLLMSISGAPRMLRDAYSPVANRSEIASSTLLTTSSDLLVLDSPALSFGGLHPRQNRPLIRACRGDHFHPPPTPDTTPRISTSPSSNTNGSMASFAGRRRIPSNSR